jgi:S1-C subfamily serine protease
MAWPKFLPGVVVLLSLGMACASAEDTLANTIDRIKPSVVGVGTFHPTAQPRNRLLGTGFAVGDGRHIVTNDHVVPTALDRERREELAVFIHGASTMRRAERVATAPRHDLALLRIEGDPLPVVSLGDSDRVREGHAVAVTGFPIGAVIGLFPATHIGIIASISPVVIPANRASELDSASIRRMRDAFPIFQLDLTAYPGNSGSPLYNPRTGRVVGVLNMVFVHAGRERALDRPSGISYAIPVKHVRDLLDQVGLRP